MRGDGVGDAASGNVKTRRIGGCADAERDLKISASCCNSCHEDDDLGYEMEYIEVNETDYYYVCCAVLHEYERALHLEQPAREESK